MSQNPIKTGAFVRSRSNKLGVGRLSSRTQSRFAEVTYFVSPAQDGYEVRRVPADSLEQVVLQEQKRVFWHDPTEGIWHSGRINYTGTVPAAALQRLPEPPKGGDFYLVRLPNQRDVAVPAESLEVRWSVSIEDPTAILATRTHDSPYWHPGRSALVKALALQRARYGGLTGLASSSISLFSHQVSAVRRILSDPVPRYILADEVGLGKTIEAGVILRQHLLDYADDAFVVIVVPPHLIEQWRSELSGRFHLAARLDTSIHILSVDEVHRLDDLNHSPSLLVVDEAHQICSAAYTRATQLGKGYELLQTAAGRASHVLLLTATPVLHNEAGFLAMLNLLDPLTYDLNDREGFRDLVKGRQAIGDIVRSLSDDVDSLFLEEAIAQLRALISNDERLDELLQNLQPLIDEDENDGRRQVAVREVRAHIQEGYRLHRRLVRTRRDSDEVRHDLPLRQYELHSFDSSARQAAFEFLESWRLPASSENNGGERESEAIELFSRLVESALCHPSVLRRAVFSRVEILRADHDLELFDGELDILASGADRLEFRDVPFLEGLAKLVKDKADAGIKCIVFVSDESTAQEIGEALEGMLPESVRRHGPDPSSVEEFLVNDGVRALICGPRAETGLNLQVANACIVHADLPMSANRIEQRIGRLDRLGARSNVVSVILTPTGGYEAAWCALIKDSVRVFERSIASLQYALHEVEAEIRRRLLHEGVEALEDLRVALADPHGSRSLDREIALVASQDALDALESFEAGDSSFFERLEDFEYGDDVGVFRKAMNGWSVENLLLGLEAESEESAVRYSYRSRGRETLLAQDDLLHHLGPSIDGAATRRRGMPVTFPMVYSREQAQRTGLRLARVGNAFVDGMSDLVRADDRGVAFAFWRFLPRYAPKPLAELYYRFDFVVEVDCSIAIDQLERFGRISGPAIRRRADEVFRPIAQTVWLDADGESVSDAAVLKVLEVPYSPNQARWGGSDISLRPADRWPVVDELGIAADWTGACWRARERAEQVLRVDTGLEELCVEAVEVVQKRVRDVEIKMLSRIARAGGNLRASEEHTLDLERELAKSIEDGIREPLVRIDAAGALFLASFNPFEKRAP